MKPKNLSFIRSVILFSVLLLSENCMGDREKANVDKMGKIPEDICPELLQHKWERSNKAVLEGFMHAYQPCVVEVPDPDYPYRMFFFGWIAEVANPEYAGCDAIYFARSSNLLSWEIYCKDGGWDTTRTQEKWASVLYASENDEQYYDTFHTGDPSVVLKDGIFHMAYSATSRPFTDSESPQPIEPPMFSNLYIEGYPSRMIQCIMGATSKDGIHWEKTGRPLLISEADYKYPPDPDPSRIGDFHRPCLLWDEGEDAWKLYFDYHTSRQGGTDKKWTDSMDDFVAGRVDAGLAVNRGDFHTGTFEFIHSLDAPLLSNWPNPEVVKTGSCYYAFSDAYGYEGATAPIGREVNTWQRRQLQVAHSKDGYNWDKIYTLDPDPGIDANHVPQAMVCKQDGKWWIYLFYTTQVGWREGKMDHSLFKTGEYNWFYDQIRYMKQEIYQPIHK